jgi:hypothetical protein
MTNPQFDYGRENRSTAQTKIRVSTRVFRDQCSVSSRCRSGDGRRAARVVQAGVSMRGESSISRRAWPQSSSLSQLMPACTTQKSVSTENPPELRIVPATRRQGNAAPAARGPEHSLRQTSQEPSEALPLQEQWTFSPCSGIDRATSRRRRVLPAAS